VSGVPIRVALTVDAEHPDRPTEGGVTERLLDALELASVRASFFIQGRWAEAYPATARSIATGGHLVGNHSHYHARMPLLTDAGLTEDIVESGRIIVETTGVDPRPWFRCPFGAGARDPRVLAAIAEAGYRHAGWHVAVEDWEPGRDATSIERDLVDGVATRADDTVILLHGWPSGTLAALPGTIARLRDMGAAFVRIDELDEVPAAPSWA
jgi:peptidoglycan/xylan/chitin deacetylase (PgdA/CDA1 family)